MLRLDLSPFAWTYAIMMKMIRLMATKIPCMFVMVSGTNVGWVMDGAILVWSVMVLMVLVLPVRYPQIKVTFI